MDVPPAKRPRVDPRQGYRYNPASKVSSEDGSKALKRAESGAGGLGRKAGIAVFWLLLAYLVGMSSVSIIPSLFFPEIGPRPTGPTVSRCAMEISALERTLMDRTAATLRDPQTGGASRWLAAWDARYLALDGGCGPLENARKDLAGLRTGLEALLNSYEQGPMQVRERIRRALQSLSERRREPNAKSPPKG